MSNSKENSAIVSSIYGTTAKAGDAKFWNREMTRGWVIAQNTGRKAEEIALYRDAKKMLAACEALGGVA